MCKLFLSILDKYAGGRTWVPIELTITSGYPYDRFIVSGEKNSVMQQSRPLYIRTPSDYSTISALPFRAVCNTEDLPDETSSAASISWARRQIFECCMRHTCLPEAQATPLPTRVLEVSGPDETMVKLVVTSRQPARYVCLSHCWGDQALIVRTTRSTLRDHVEGILIAKLPATFRDAVDITRRLGIKYIWIDSLCIIQDSDEDWQAESARMAEIYENSYVTIAATASTNGQGGCYRTTSEAERDQEIELISDVDEPSRLFLRPVLGHFDLSHDVHLNDREAGFPLLERAWVLQERLLSPRMLHFCDRELIFECRETTQCQCGEAEGEANMKAEFIHMLESGPTFGPTRARIGWWTLVQRYTRLGLTFDKDRLPALSGMARRMKGQLANDYQAGIWRSSFPEGLLWRVDFPDRGFNVAVVSPRRLPEPRAPSWSWASLAAAVTWAFPHRLGDNTAGIEIQEANCSPVRNDTYGQVQGGILRITGLVTHSLMQRREHSEPPGDENNDGASGSVGGTEPEFTEWDFSALSSLSVKIHVGRGYTFFPDYDLDGEEQSPIEVVCLWAMSTRLLILRLVERSQRFERIGICTWDHGTSLKDLERFPEVQRTTLEIV